MKRVKHLFNKKIAISFNILLLVCFLIFRFPLTAFSQEPVNADQQDVSGKIEIYNDQDWQLFEDDKPLRFALTFDYKLFRKNVSKSVYQPAVLSVHLSDTVIDREIRIRARGISRKVICTFPPIKLNLKEADLESTQLHHQTTLKIVTHCKNSSMYQKYIFKEYLIYKMYSLLTDFSFKVRLVQIDYIDSNQKQKTFTKYGFLIEHIKALAERKNCLELENEQLAQKWMNEEVMPLLCVFQYMIGNTDWSVAGLHNLKVVKSKNYATPKPYPIPYDFDYSGFVDTDYAVPTEGLGLESVRVRAFSCVCFEESSIYDAVDHIVSNKEALYKLIDDFEYLEKKDKGFLTKYLNSFFKMMENDKIIKREFIDRCHK